LNIYADLIERFAAKAIQAADRGSTVVLLIPSWPGYEWTQLLKRRGRVQDLIGPVQFEKYDGSRVIFNNGSRSTSLMVVTLGPQVEAGTFGPPIRRPNALEQPSESHSPSIAVRPHNRTPKLITLSGLTPQRVEWLWPPRIPIGEITLIDGDPSVNKSSLLLDLAARVSTGREMPDGAAGVDGGVLLLMAEDSLRKTVLQRLTAAGADLRRIAAPLPSVAISGDLALIEEAASRIGAALIVIDPLMAHLNHDANNDQKVRVR
jgi:hypothetical protein